MRITASRYLKLRSVLYSAVCSLSVACSYRHHSLAVGNPPIQYGRHSSCQHGREDDSIRVQFRDSDRFDEIRTPKWQRRLEGRKPHSSRRVATRTKQRSRLGRSWRRLRPRAGLPDGTPAPRLARFAVQQVFDGFADTFVYLDRRIPPLVDTRESDDYRSVLGAVNLPVLIVRSERLRRRVGERTVAAVVGLCLTDGLVLDG